MRRGGYFLLVLAAVALVGLLAAPRLRHRRDAVRAAGGAAFTVGRIERFYSPSGVVDSKVSVFARREDGSTVSRQDLFDSHLSGIRVITDLGIGRRATVDPLTRSTTTYLLTPKEVRALAQPDLACTRPGLPSGKILGQDVAEVDTTLSVSGGEFTFRSWEAPALNCLPLRRLTTEPNGGRADLEAVSVRVGAPAASLFVVPAGYAERTPSQVLAVAAQLRGTRCAACGGISARQLDSIYRAKQSLPRN